MRIVFGMVGLVAARLAMAMAMAQGAGPLPPVVVLPPPGVLAASPLPPVVVAPDARALFGPVPAVARAIPQHPHVVARRVPSRPRVSAPSLLYAPPPYYAVPADLPRPRPYGWGDAW